MTYLYFRFSETLCRLTEEDKCYYYIAGIWHESHVEWSNRKVIDSPETYELLSEDEIFMELL